MRLHPTVPFIDGETPVSFVGRLAHLNGVAINAFCSDFELALAQLIRGNDENLARLADLAQADLETLMEAAWIAEGSHQYYRDEIFHFGEHRSESSRACIQCLLDDHAASPDGACICFRGEWRVSALRTCDVHKAALVDLPRTDSRRMLKGFPAVVLDQLNNLTTPALQRAPSGLENYIRARLRGRPHAPTFLDTSPISVVVSSCEAIGASALLGDAPNRRAANDDERWAAGERGFHITSAGEDSIAAFLKDSQIGLDGALCRWFTGYKAKSADYDPFREIFTRHVEENVAYRTDTKLFGRPLASPKVTTVRWAIEDLQIPSGYIRRAVLSRLPETERTKTNCELRFRMEDFADEWLRISSALERRELTSHMGCSRKILNSLIRQGYIKPILAPASDCPGIPLFARKEVDAFLKKLFARAQPAEEAPCGARPVNIPPGGHPCPAPVVIDLILGGKLAWVGRRDDVRGIDGLLVDMHELRAKITGSVENLTIYQAIPMMGVTPRAFYRMAKLGTVQLLPITQPRNIAAVPRITFEEITRFRKKYVSVTDAGKQLSIGLRTLISQLQAAEIQPMDLGSIPLLLYERAHIASLYPAIMEDTELAEIRRSLYASYQAPSENHAPDQIQEAPPALEASGDFAGEQDAHAQVLTKYPGLPRPDEVFWDWRKFG